MKLFIYFNDGYHSDGDVGLKICQTREEVEEFITERIRQNPKRTLAMYTVIEGKELIAKPIEVITKIQLS